MQGFLCYHELPKRYSPLIAMGAVVLKTEEALASVGSNPTLSAIMCIASGHPFPGPTVLPLRIIQTVAPKTDPLVRRAQRLPLQPSVDWPQAFREPV